MTRGRSGLLRRAVAAAVVVFVLWALVRPDDVGVDAPPPPAAPGDEPEIAGDPAVPGAAGSKADATAGAAANAAAGPDEVLPPGAAEAGLVVVEVAVRAEESELPIPGAAVTLYPGGEIEHDGGTTFQPILAESPLASRTADERGRVRLTLYRGEIFTVAASAKGRARAYRGLRLEAEAPSPVVLRLAPGGVLRGTVRRADGRPAAGARVHVGGPGVVLPEGLRVEWLDFTRSLDLFESTADGDGRYEVAGLPVGTRHSVGATLAGYGRSAVLDDVVPPASDLPLTRDLVVLPDGRLRVRPVLPGGTPPDDWSIEVTQAGFGVRVSLSGREYVTELLPPQRLEVEVLVPGYPRVSFVVDLRSGEDRTVTVPIPAGVAVEGTVVDDRGTPVADVVVRADGREPAPGGEFRVRDGASDRTDDRGRFRIGPLLPGPKSLTAVGEAHASSEPVRVDAPATGIRLVVRRHARIRARLSLPPGVPALDVILFSPNRPRTVSVSGAADLEWTVAPGPSEIVALVPGYVPFRRVVDAAPGAEIDLGEIPLDPGLGLAGRVVDPAGVPVAGATVREAAGRFGAPEARTDAEGRFVLEHLEAARILLVAAAPGHLPTRATVDVAAATGPVELRLRTGGTLELRLAGPDGRPVSRGRVRAIPLGGEEEPRRIDMNGASTERALLPPGRWRVEVVGRDGAAEASAEVEIRPGATTLLALDLPPR